MKRAFTLIEILIVVVIIGMLSSSLLPKFASFKDKAENAGAIKETRDIDGSLDLYQIDNGTYPVASTCDGTIKTDCSINSISSYLVKYLSTIPKGNPALGSWAIGDSYVVPPGHPYGYVGLENRYILSYMFVDIRDRRRYKAVKMPDGKRWMAENLNYKTPTGSLCYNDLNDQASCNTIYGRFYNFNAAKIACPPGWALPTDYDWTILLNSIEDLEGGISNHDLFGWVGSKAGGALKMNTGAQNGLDTYGFSALLGGRCDNILPWYNFGTYGSYSTASLSGANPIYRLFGGSQVFHSTAGILTSNAVRCVRD